MELPERLCTIVNRWTLFAIELAWLVTVVAFYDRLNRAALGRKICFTIVAATDNLLDFLVGANILHKPVTHLLKKLEDVGNRVEKKVSGLLDE